MTLRRLYEACCIQPHNSVHAVLAVTSAQALPVLPLRGGRECRPHLWRAEAAAWLKSHAARRSSCAFHECSALLLKPLARLPQGQANPACGCGSGVLGGPGACTARRPSTPICAILPSSDVRRILQYTAVGRAACVEMTRGERAIVRARLEYGYAHPDCGLAAPPCAAADAALSVDLQLLMWWVPALSSCGPCILCFLLLQKALHIGLCLASGGGCSIVEGHA